MDYSSIKELIEIIDKSKFVNFELELDGAILKLSKESNDVKTLKEIPQNIQNDRSIEDVREEKVEDENNLDSISGEMITAPIVGTFYSSPGIDKESFVDMDSVVKKGDTVCILEAMKIMNEIPSPRDGKIVKILVENEQMVEYGQPLFIIE